MNRLYWNKISRTFLLLLLCCLIQSCSSSGGRQGTLKGHSVPNSDKNLISICTWNLENFGYSKNKNQIDFIANIISNNDIIAIQEVSGKSGGADAVIRLAYSLDSICKDCHWDYSISLLTTGHSHQRERYAYLWKRSRVSHIGLGWLDQKYSDSIEREPFLATFEVGKKKFTLVNFHAIPKSRQPETEIKYLKNFPKEYSNKHLIFLGDFNISYTHSVFNPLKKQGYRPALIDQKTTLRQKCINGDCLASKYDNILYPSQYIKSVSCDIIHFYRNFNGNMKNARKISDHVPVVFKFSLKGN